MLKGNNTISSVIKGSTTIQIIKKGLTTVYEAFKKLLVSGIPPISLTNSIGKDLVDYKIYGNSIQDGTPTPETPIEVESVGDLVTDTTDANYGKYKIPVKILGINKLDQTDEIEGYNINTKGVVEQTISADATQKEYIKVKNSTYYTFTKNTVDTKDQYWRVCFYDEDYNPIVSSRVASNKNSFSVLSPKECTYLRCSYPINSNPMVVEGKINYDYEKYIEPQITNIYINEPLRKIGDYSDYIDFENQKIVRNIKERIFDGTENWKKHPFGTNCYYIYDNDLLINEDIETINSNYFKGVSYTNRTISENNIVFIDINYKSINFRNTEHNDINSFIDFLKKNSVKVNCILATPIEESIKLPNIPTLKNTTVLQVNTKIQPSNMEVRYKGK